MLKAAYRIALEKGVLPIGDRIEGGGFMRWLRTYRREQWLPEDQLSRLTQSRLAAILEHAVTNVPFYRNLGLKSSDPFENLADFPIITKSDINDHIGELVAMPIEELIAESGSGSSGLQGTVYMEPAAQASQRAMQMLWFEWCGYRIGDSILQTGMTLDRGLVKGAKDLLLNTMYVPAFHLSQKSISDILSEVRRRPRKYFFGYASALHTFADTAIACGYSDIKFDHAVSWGDKLFPHYRDRIRQAFGCETLDTYGCTEGAMVAAQCEAGNYHLSVNQCVIEIVDEDGRPLPDGQLGRVVATRLDNFAMPLIRYDLGDIAAKIPYSAGKCSCGRRSPLLEGLIGRDTDVVRTRTGKQMIVHFFTAIFEHRWEIRQFKVIQRSLDRIEIEYIPGNNFSTPVLEMIEAQIRDHLKEDLPIDWKEVRVIPPTASGKPQIIQSLLGKNRR